MPTPGGPKLPRRRGPAAVGATFFAPPNPPLQYGTNAQPGAPAPAARLPRRLGPAAVGPTFFAARQKPPAAFQVGNPATISFGGISVFATSIRTVIGVAAVNFGAATVTATSKRTVLATAAVTLGGISITTSDTDTVFGVSAVSFGAITVSVTSKRTVWGAGTVQSGALNVSATSLHTAFGLSQVAFGGIVVGGQSFFKRPQQGGSGNAARKKGIPLLPEGIGLPLNYGVIPTVVEPVRWGGRFEEEEEKPKAKPSLKPVIHRVSDEELEAILALYSQDMLPF